MVPHINNLDHTTNEVHCAGKAIPRRVQYLLKGYRLGPSSPKTGQFVVPAAKIKHDGRNIRKQANLLFICLLFVYLYISGHRKSSG